MCVAEMGVHAHAVLPNAVFATNSCSRVREEQPKEQLTISCMHRACFAGCMPSCTLSSV
jgi:hypothetical protein